MTVLSELTNWLEYSNRENTVPLTIHEEENQYVVTLSNSGESEYIEKSSSFGLSLHPLFSEIRESCIFEDTIRNFKPKIVYTGQKTIVEIDLTLYQSSYPSDSIIENVTQEIRQTVNDFKGKSFRKINFQFEKEGLEHRLQKIHGKVTTKNPHKFYSDTSSLREYIQKSSEYTQKDRKKGRNEYNAFFNIRTPSKTTREHCLEIVSNYTSNKISCTVDSNITIENIKCTGNSTIYSVSVKMLEVPF